MKQIIRNGRNFRLSGRAGRAVLASVLLCCALSAFAGGKKDSADSSIERISVGVLNGPSGIPAAYMVENAAQIGGVRAEYEVFAAANQLLPKLVKGECDIGFLPPNVAAKAYNSGSAALLNAGVAGNGMLSLISRDASLSSWKGLEGKKVAVAGAGATPEYVLRYILEKKGVKPELDFSIPNSEIAAALISGKVDYAVVPEPFSTVACMKDSSVRRVFDIQKEFAACGGMESFPMTLIVVRKEFAEAHPNLVSEFQKAYAVAEEWTKANPKESGALVQKSGMSLAAPVVAAAIPNANFVFALPKDSRAALESLLGVFLQFAPESVAGRLPDDGFYFKK